MSKPVIGLVGLCSPVESGGQRYDELMAAASKALEAAGVEVVVGKKSVWGPEDAIQVIDQFKEAKIDALAVMDVTWVCDSLKYLFVQELPVPVVFWAVPYPETFSIGCIQNFGSILKIQNIHFEYVYGLADDPAVIAKVVEVAKAGQIVKRAKSMRIALVGPRQTWRVAGPQDMTTEEWDFSRKLGPTIIHLEMEDITDEAKKISDEKAEEILKGLADKTGEVKCTHEVMLWMAKVYQASKDKIDSMGLDAFAAECYPNYGGLMNQTASWLSEEGYVVDTEGDIAHVFTQFILNEAAGSGACALGEVGAYNDADGYLTICHEGSTAPSLADGLDKVVTNPSGDTGSFIGVPVKAMDEVTFCDMQGVDGKYRLMIANGSTLPVSHDEWVAAGEKLVAKLKVDGVAPSEIVAQMIEHGMHHHFILKEGNQKELAELVCKYMDIEVINLK